MADADAVLVVWPGHFDAMRVQAVCIFLLSVGAFVAAQDLTTNVKVPAFGLCQPSQRALCPMCSPGHA